MAVLIVLKQIPLLLFSAQGIDQLRKYISKWACGVLIVVSLWPHVDWIGRLWVNQQEWSVATSALSKLPKDSKVQVDGTIEKWGKKATVFEWVANFQIEVVPLRREEGWFWRGPLCSIRPNCIQFMQECKVVRVQTQKFPNHTDSDLQVAETEIEIGLYRVVECTTDK